MTKNSIQLPQVPCESPTLRVPLFLNKSQQMTSFTLSSLQTIDDELSSDSQARTLFRSLTNESIMKTTGCNCPQVLIADDDPFQQFYYKTLFKRSITTKSCSSVNQGSLRVEVLRSGEDLLDRYTQIQTCNCHGLLAIISDYNMGKDNMNGVEVILALRGKNFEGPVILRTSEEEDDLHTIHPRFREMVEIKTITNVLDKDNHRRTKDVIQEILSKQELMSTEAMKLAPKKTNSASNIITKKEWL